MEYVLTIYPDAERPRTEDEKAQGAIATRDYVMELIKQGAYRDGRRIADPEEAVQVRWRDGTTEVAEGPCVDTGPVGGYLVIEAPDREAAVKLAAGSPAAGFGAIEVRAVVPPPGL